MEQPMAAINNRRHATALATLAWAFVLFSGAVFAERDKHSQLEIETLFPMFFMNGYHLAVGLRQNQWRLRASCIDGGNYDYEPNNDVFERNLGKGCGLFMGHFFDRHWHAYLFIERQEYIVTRRSSGASATFRVTDIGPGLGYQYFLTKDLYLQPALHLYWREKASKTIDGIDYTLRNSDVSLTVRLGYQF
jgi:hypothetical protein